ncbi:hypothetical protein E3N88_45931 [Mikania micrantha]|uniref:Replication factor A C-terminal domain-containing protein n=1 Tax=Mikania micrantha TaxID=192012 RepID=A0A5N6L7N4_9ASTR|nr:hypothetical protein E3N88_45931 [Mikania micrantha]
MAKTNTEEKYPNLRNIELHLLGARIIGVDGYVCMERIQEKTRVHSSIEEGEMESLSVIFQWSSGMKDRIKTVATNGNGTNAQVINQIQECQAWDKDIELKEMEEQLQELVVFLKPSSSTCKSSLCCQLIRCAHTQMLLMFRNSGFVWSFTFECPPGSLSHCSHVSYSSLVLLRLMGRTCTWVLIMSLGMNRSRLLLSSFDKALIAPTSCYQYGCSYLMNGPDTLHVDLHCHHRQVLRTHKGKRLPLHDHDHLNGTHEVRWNNISKKKVCSMRKYRTSRIDPVSYQNKHLFFVFAIGGYLDVRKPCVSTAFNVSRVFINDDVDEINTFKKSKKLSRKLINTQKSEGSDEVVEKTVFECKNVKCQQPASVVPRLKLAIRVQDATGLLSLTLFDREATRIFQKSAKDFLEKYLEGGYNRMLPDEFYDLVNKKYAFKIEITDYNLKNNCQIFTLSKMTDAPSIIEELESRFNINQDVSYTGDNATLTSNGEKNSEKHTYLNQNTSTLKADTRDLKRSLCDIYDVDDPVSFSATKGRPSTSLGAKAYGKLPLLTPKLEK